MSLEVREDDINTTKIYYYSSGCRFYEFGGEGALHFPAKSFSGGERTGKGDRGGAILQEQPRSIDYSGRE